MKSNALLHCKKINISFPHLVHISGVEISAAKNIFVWQVLTIS